MTVSLIVRVEKPCSEFWISCVSEVRLVVETQPDWELLCVIIFFCVDTVERDFGVFDLHARNFFHNPTASIFRIKTKMKKPCNELKIVNRSWEILRSSMPVKSRMAKSHVSPKRNITPLMLNIIRRMVLALIFSCFRATLPLLCRISTTTKMKRLKSIMARIGARNVPQNTSAWEMKQLKNKSSWLWYVVV